MPLLILHNFWCTCIYNVFKNHIPPPLTLKQCTLFIVNDWSLDGRGFKEKMAVVVVCLFVNSGPAVMHPILVLSTLLLR